MEQNKTPIGILLSLVVVAAIAIGAYFYPQIVAFGTPSTAGSSFSSAKFAGITAALSAPGANATSSSVLNTDATDRYVTGFRLGCQGIGTSKTAYTGAGLAALNVSVGTSSTAAPATLAPFVYVAQNFTIPTTTPDNAVATSSGATSPLGEAALWRSGEYMTFATNATNTAACTFGVDYLPG